jgi:HTH-type transcriptional regulator/antitoxin HigA
VEITSVNTESAYRAALAEVSALIDADPKLGTAGADRLEVLVALVQAYEAKHHAID